MDVKDAWKLIKAKARLEGEHQSVETKCALAIVDEARRREADNKRLRADVEVAKQEPPLYRWLLDREEHVERINFPQTFKDTP